MKRNVLLFVTAVALLLSAVLVTSASALSEKDWRKQADNICSQSITLITEESKTVTTGANGQPSAVDFSNFILNTVKPNYEQVISAIKYLPKPSSLKTKINTLIKQLTKATKAIDADVTPESLGKLFNAPTKSAKSLGLKVCGQ